MHVLQLVKWLSAHQTNGGEMRSISLGRVLAGFAAVDVIGFRSGDDALQSAPALAHYRDMYTVCLDGLVRRGAWTLANLGRGYSLRSARFRSPAYCQRVAEVLRTRHYDAVQVEEVSLLQTLAPLPSGVPVVYSSHNVESVLAPRMLRARAGVLRHGVWFDRGRTAAEERRAVEQANMCLVVSAADQRLLASLAPGRASAIHVIPNCVGDDVVPAAPVPSGAAAAEVVCVASFGWYPNVQGARWFLAAVVPRLRGSGAACAVRFVGSRIDATLAEQIVAAGCQYSADVASTLPFLHRARAAVVPLLIGGGTRIKIVEAWAAGVPVVSTRVGAEGLDCADGVDALLADDPESFADALRRVLEDDALYGRLRANGLRRAEVLRWSRVAPRLERLYASLARDAAEATA